jgi:mannose-6-phosphate isomerase-like protein (cupin superfamily)
MLLPSITTADPAGSTRMHPSTSERRYEVIDFSDLAPVDCPCGTARRALMAADDVPLSIHQTEISADARPHYHRRLTESYFVLECAADAKMELDGDWISLKPGQLVLIRPGVRHRAVGPMKVLVIVSPKFDPADEWFD